MEDNTKIQLVIIATGVFFFLGMIGMVIVSRPDINDYRACVVEHTTYTDKNGLKPSDPEKALEYWKAYCQGVFPMVKVTE